MFVVSGEPLFKPLKMIKTPALVRVPLRKLRCSMQKYPLYFYWRKEILQVFTGAGTTRTQVRRLDFSGYWTHARR